MTARRKHPKIELRHEEMEKSQQLSVSQTETYDQVSRAKILLAYQARESKSAIAWPLGVSRPTVDFLCAGIQVVIGNLRRPEWPNIVTADEKA